MKNKQLYTGYAANLKRRIVEHKRSGVKSTKKSLPIKLVHYEAYSLKSDAKRREKFLKKSQGKKFLKQQIRDFLVKYRLVATYPRG